jgi:S-adenosylmethionine decarboxylase
VTTADKASSGLIEDPCPEIIRQRLVIEGRFCIPPPDAAFIERFLLELSRRLGMRPLTRVLTFSPERHSDLHHGVAGFLPWVESGCSIYTWADKRFFSLEIFSCKPFDEAPCLDYTASRLQARDLITRSL